MRDLGRFLLDVFENVVPGRVKALTLAAQVSMERRTGRPDTYLDMFR
jgi:hypothetical protein